MNDVNFQDGSLQMVGEISNLFKEEFELTYPNLVDHHSLSKIEKMFTDAISSGVKLRVATTSGNIVGFMMFKSDFLDQLYISKQFQGKGLGKHFMDELFSEKGSSISLYTLASNRRAIEFYQSFSFKIVKEGMSPDEKVPDVEMQWEKKA